MDQSLAFRLTYIVVGLLAATITVLRLMNGAAGGALFTGAIAAFCGYRLYNYEDDPSS